MTTLVRSLYSAGIRFNWGRTVHLTRCLTEDELLWLIKTTPAGMTIIEYLATFVRDAYADEVKEND